MEQVTTAVKDTMLLIEAYSGKALSKKEAEQFLQSWNHIMAVADIPTELKAEVGKPVIDLDQLLDDARDMMGEHLALEGPPLSEWK